MTAVQRSTPEATMCINEMVARLMGHREDVTRAHAPDVAEIEREMGKKFELRPTICLDSSVHEPCNRCREGDGGKLVVAEIALPIGLKAHPELLSVIVRHEIRENLAIQNFSGSDEGHRYAVSREAEDLVRFRLSPEWYSKVQTDYGSSGDKKFFSNLTPYSHPKQATK